MASPPLLVSRIFGRETSLRLSLVFAASGLVRQSTFNKIVTIVEIHAVMNPALK